VERLVLRYLAHSSMVIISEGFIFSLQEKLSIYIRREESKLIDIDIVQRTLSGIYSGLPKTPAKRKTPTPSTYYQEIGGL